MNMLNKLFGFLIVWLFSGMCLLSYQHDSIGSAILFTVLSMSYFMVVK